MVIHVFINLIITNMKKNTEDTLIIVGVIAIGILFFMLDHIRFNF